MTTRWGEKIKLLCPFHAQACTHRHSQTHTNQLLPLHAPLNSCVISTQLAWFLIFSGMPSPLPVSSSSAADFITLVTILSKIKKVYWKLFCHSYSTSCIFCSTEKHLYFKFTPAMSKYCLYWWVDIYSPRYVYSRLEREIIKNI